MPRDLLKSDLGGIEILISPAALQHLYLLKSDLGGIEIMDLTV